MDTSRLHLHPSFQIGAAWWGVRAALRAGGGGGGGAPWRRFPSQPSRRSESRDARAYRTEPVPRQGPAESLCGVGDTAHGGDFPDSLLTAVRRGARVIVWARCRAGRCTGTVACAPRPRRVVQLAGRCRAIAHCCMLATVDVEEASVRS